MEIQEIVSRKAELIKLKKAATKFTDGWSSPSLSVNKTANKADTDASVLDKTIVGNTYYWMDSHDDVHVKGCFTKSVKENARIFHLHDHEFKISAQIGKISRAYEQDLPWSTFGVEKDGNTTSLLADTKVLKSMNGQIFNSYKSGEIDQHSVGMQYVTLSLAVKERNDEWKEENKAWDEIYPMLGNPERADEKGYLWIVRECKLIEISAVLMGSNSLTPTLENKQEPSNDTLADAAAAKALQLNNFFNHLKL